MGVIRLHLRLHRRKTYAIFVDFKRASGSLQHSILWNKIFQSGISSTIVRILKQLYLKAYLQVKINNYVSNSIKITADVLQGEILSPLFFLLFSNDIESYFRQKN